MVTLKEQENREINEVFYQDSKDEVMCTTKDFNTTWRLQEFNLAQSNAQWAHRNNEFSELNEKKIFRHHLHMSDLPLANKITKDIVSSLGNKWAKSMTNHNNQNLVEDVEVRSK